MTKRNRVTGVRSHSNGRQHGYAATQGNMAQSGADRATHDDEAAQEKLRNREHEFQGGSLERSGYGESADRGRFGDLSGQGNRAGQSTIPSTTGNTAGEDGIPPAPTSEREGKFTPDDAPNVDYQREKPVEPEPRREPPDKIVRRANIADKKSRKRMH